MKLCSTKISLEVGYSFSISHKVGNLIVSTLNEDIMVPCGLDKLDPDVFLDLQVCTDSQCNEIKVVKPERVCDDFLTWKMWLPYKKIVDADDYLDEYLNCFFEASVIVFNEYAVSSDLVFSVKSKVKAEVLNNTEYEYVQGFVSKVAKYDFD